MKQQGNFLLLEKSEFREWLKKQAVTRSINRLQVHHTASPNYTTRRMVNGIAQQDHFVCLEGMRNYHIGMEYGATAQHLTIFEDGKVGVSLDRDFNKTPAGIKGSNTGAICIELIGYFDKGQDKMTDAQKQSVLHVYACLAEKLKLPINTNTIVYHAWYTKTGKRLNDYKQGQSSKSCPGTGFWGDGNTIAAAKKNFLPQITQELHRLQNNIVKEDEPMTPQEKAEFKALIAKVDQLENSKDVLKKSLSEQRTTITTQEKEIQVLKNKLNMEKIPSYAQEAINILANMKDSKGNPVVNTPNGRSADFYSLVTVLHRAGVFK
ncbi:MAG: N-acetylmuramoyl-L-alanine amidase [Bacillota bacterium]